MNGYSANPQTISGLSLINCDEIDINKFNDGSGNILTNGTIQTKSINLNGNDLATTLRVLEYDSTNSIYPMDYYSGYGGYVNTYCNAHIYGGLVLDGSLIINNNSTTVSQSALNNITGTTSNIQSQDRKSVV